MKRDEIRQAPAGPTLDWHIAHFVMGLPNKELTSFDCPCAYCGSQMRYCGARSWCSDCHEWRYTAYKNYSDEIESAQDVIDKAYSMSLDKYSDGEEWRCYLVFSVNGKNADGNGIAKTAPLAICRAALVAMMEFSE